MNEQPHQDRRSFLKAMGGSTAVIAAVPVILKPAPAQAQDNAAALAGGGRGYVAGRFALELDGAHAGWVQSVEGGHATADVVTEKVGTDLIERKHLAGVKYSEISISCGAGMSKAFYDWITDSFDNRASRKNGAIIATDFRLKEVGRLTFYNALIMEIGLPALDAASKDAAKMTVKFAPEYTRRMPPATSAQLPATAEKKWLPANFKLSIDGLDCSRVSKIEALTIKQKVTENPPAGERDYENEPAWLEIPNLEITLPDSHAETFYDWHEDFVIKGNNSQQSEKGGTLSWLDHHGGELGRLQFGHLGIFKLAPEKLEAGSENIRRIKAEMYCEEMEFKFNASWA